jgi:hypothetical protein
LGVKFLVVLCAGFMLLLGEDAPAFSGAIVWSVTKLASITFWSLAFSYWFDKPWFHNWGKLADVLLIPSSWGSQLGALTSHHHSHPNNWTKVAPEMELNSLWATKQNA